MSWFIKLSVLARLDIIINQIMQNQIYRFLNSKIKRNLIIQRNKHADNRNGSSLKKNLTILQVVRPQLQIQLLSSYRSQLSIHLYKNSPHIHQVVKIAAFNYIYLQLIVQDHTFITVQSVAVLFPQLQLKDMFNLPSFQSYQDNECINLSSIDILKLIFAIFCPGIFQSANQDNVFKQAIVYFLTKSLLLPFKNSHLLHNTYLLIVFIIYITFIKPNKMFRDRSRGQAYRFDQIRAVYSGREVCSVCRKIYSEQHQCKVACPYCHEFHNKTDLIENICPLVYPFAKKQQQKHSFQCKNCKGEGLFTEEVETIKYQTFKKFQERLKEWSEALRIEQNHQEQKPTRRILQKQKTAKEIQCSDCDGKGRIMRLMQCCSQGCRSCNGDRYIINPIWKTYRKEPVQNQHIFQCPICLMDVEAQGQKYVLHCRHEFHPDCIFRWMKTKRNCPVCRQTDLYMEGIEFQPNLAGQRGEGDLNQHQSRIRIRIESQQDW